MKKLLQLATLAGLLVGCASTHTTITDPSGAQRVWEPAQVDLDHSAAPVRSSTETEKHIWTQTPVPNVPPMHDQFPP
jgi:hypothetical protein